jgi:hypothetical protein
MCLTVSQRATHAQLLSSAGAAPETMREGCAGRAKAGETAGTAAAACMYSTAAAGDAREERGQGCRGGGSEQAQQQSI